MKAWFAASELAQLKLPELPATFQGINKRARSEGWPCRKVAGVTQYPADALPELARLELMRRETAAAVPAPAPKAAPPTTLSADLRDYQREPMQARQLILNHIANQVLMLGVSRLKAEEAFCRMAAAGELPEYLQNAVRDANARSGEGRLVSAGSLRRWRLAFENGGAASLAVKAAKAWDELPGWFEPFWKLKAIPSDPSVASVYEKFKTVHPGIVIPSLRSVQRFVNGLDAITKNRGRFGPREMKKFRAYKTRDFSMLEPGTIYSSDGHRADLEVVSPDGKSIIRPEIITVIDVATRRIVGWACGEHESALLVGDALLMACKICVPAIFYVDNGSGYVNAYFKDPDAGLLAALGIEMVHALPYNSQAKGVIERFHQMWVRAAKFQPTYMGADMDAEAKNIVFKRDRKELKLHGRTRYAMQWADFLKWAKAQIDDYNDRPHGAFPKIRDAQDYMLRHPSPNEVWRSFVERGFEPVLPEQHALDDARRPYKTVTVNRGRVRVNNGVYGHERLDADGWHGRAVRVGFDLHASDKVWVRAMDGRLICVAQLDWNKVAWMPSTVIERGEEKRAAAQLRNAERKVEELRIERDGAVPQIGFRVIDGDLSPEQEAQADRMIAALEAPADQATPDAPAVPGERPIFETEEDWVRWVLAGNGDDADRDRLMARARASFAFREAYDIPLPEDGSGEEAELRAAG